MNIPLIPNENSDLNLFRNNDELEQYIELDDIEIYDVFDIKGNLLSISVEEINKIFLFWKYKSYKTKVS